jgi:hypothetical protein
MVVPPFLAPYTAAKAAMDSLAESVSVEVARYGIETCIVMPGPFTQGTEHFPNAAHAADDDVAAQYDETADALANNGAATEALFAPGVVQDVQAVADEIVRVVGLTARAPTGRRSTSPTSGTYRSPRSPWSNASDCSSASASATCSSRRRSRRPTRSLRGGVHPGLTRGAGRGPLERRRPGLPGRTARRGGRGGTRRPRCS